MKKIIIGSRGSDLALWQARFVQSELKKIEIECDIKIIKTQGDKIQDLSFDKLEGKGFFTKEIEDALLNNEIDLAVHSHKDLPTTSPEGLMIAAVSEREDPTELLLIKKSAVDAKQKFSLKKNATLGTSSARRKCQVLAFRNDLNIHELRGNVPTRIQKLRGSEYDAILIASAGVERLQIDLAEFEAIKLPPSEFVPAPAQGVLALQIRENDRTLFEDLQKLNNSEIQDRISVERGVMNLFNGGCQLPLGVYCEKFTDDDDVPFLKTWVSIAESWKNAPKAFYFESKNSIDLASKIVEKINATQAKKVFISRDRRPFDYFENILKGNGFSVVSRGLIETKAIPISSIPDTDWLFFASKNAVKYFYSQGISVKACKIGCIGKATADELRKFGQRADFIGYSTDTKLTGKQFSSMVGNQKVLFPQAKESMRSVQKSFSNPNQTKDLSVYETLKKNTEQVANFEIGVFTSPSNVDAFFEKNNLNGNEKIIAMGESTAAALKRHGVKKCALTSAFDDLGLVRAVFAQ